VAEFLLEREQVRQERARASLVQRGGDEPVAGLRRLLPLPCAKMTAPAARCGMARCPDSSTSPAVTVISRSKADPARGPGRGPGRDPVVHHDHGTELTRWLRDQPAAAIPVGYFGASTGAAAALWAANPRLPVTAIVSRGGRPDLAGRQLALVQAPTLLIVGGADEVVLDLNQRAQARLNSENRLAVIPDVTHLFEEPGALEELADLAADWFTGHFAPLGTTEPAPPA
jgi:pimeloyl-ACP methyl ester carboxylesterase